MRHGDVQRGVFLVESWVAWWERGLGRRRRWARDQWDGRDLDVPGRVVPAGHPQLQRWLRCYAWAGRTVGCDCDVRRWHGREGHWDLVSGFLEQRVDG